MDFNKDVIEKSYEQPVVVDFWAPWCGPCRILGPTIEQLAEEQKDKWTLVKVNTEEEYDVAVQYRIQSIPNVKMFHEGEVIAEFAGALPRPQILAWLEEHLPNAEKQEVEGLIEQLKSGSPSDEVVTSLEETLAERPDLTELRIALAQYFIFRSPGKALKLVESVKLGDQQSDEAEDIRTLAQLMNLQSNGESPAAEKMQAAQEAFQVGKMESGIQHLIDAVSMDKTYQKDLPRTAAIAVFRTLGPSHPLTKNYRWKFDMALY
jgi:putative thioredoxin